MNERVQAQAERKAIIAGLADAIRDMECPIQFSPLLMAALRVLSATEWQSIETAPKDGREILLAVKLRAGIPNRCLVGHYMPGGHCISDHPAINAGWYFWDGCMFDKAAEPTHWKPLDPPPTIAEEQTEDKR